MHIQLANALGWITLMLRLTLFAIVLTLFCHQAKGETGCGGAEFSCAVSLGTYHIALPVSTPPKGTKRPAVLFFHGAGGLGRDVISEQFYLRPFREAGYAIIAPNGLVRGNGFGTGWSFRPNGPQQRNELSFAKEIIADVAEKFDVDRSKILLSGFSIGSSLVWYLACKEPSLGAAYAPLAGGFWRPHPQSCAGPIDLLQTHGWRDQTVPLEGRPLRGGELYQGDIFEGLQLWRAIDGCKRLRADSFETGPIYWIRTWSSCDSGRELALALHPGDHDSIPEGWAEMVRLWFERRLNSLSQSALAP